ncbi:MAG: hypothetical protein NT046_11450 [Arenimonas sp.]|nr:hypothetical protein [Arenimonas sp.]
MARRIRSNLRCTCLLALLLPLQALAYNQDRVATDEAGNPLRIEGSVVVVEPDIELTEITAGGMHEPRREWSETARRLFPVSVGRLLEAGGQDRKPDFEIRDDLPPRSRLGQVIRLNEAVAMSIAVYTRRGSYLATKDRRLDWTLGPGVQELRDATGADYALFTYIRDSYASEGRTAMRVLGFLAGAAMGSVVDIGGGQQVGVATLVDLRTGKVVWFNLMSNQTGDLRDAEGAAKSARQMLTGLPL